MFPLASLTSIPVGLSFGWGSAIPVSMVVVLLVSAAGVLHAALAARRQPPSPRVRRQDAIPAPPESAGESQHSTIAA